MFHCCRQEILLTTDCRQHCQERVGQIQVSLLDHLPQVQGQCPLDHQHAQTGGGKAKLDLLPRDGLPGRHRYVPPGASTVGVVRLLAHFRLILITHTPVAPWVKRRTDFLSVFSHSPDGDPSKGVDVLNNDSYWVETIPHVKYTGMCHTYNPPFSSKPSVWNGLR